MAEYVYTEAYGDTDRSYAYNLLSVIAEYESHGYKLESVKKVEEHKAKLTFVKDE